MEQVGVLTVYTLAAIWDLKTREIPDTLSVALVCWGFVCNVCQERSQWTSIRGMLSIFLFLIVVCMVSESIMKRQGVVSQALGGGDIKLLTTTAYVLGTVNTMKLLLYAQLIIVIFWVVWRLRGKRLESVPLAVFLWIVAVPYFTSRR